MKLRQHTRPGNGINIWWAVCGIFIKTCSAAPLPSRFHEFTNWREEWSHKLYDVLHCMCMRQWLIRGALDTFGRNLHLYFDWQTVQGVVCLLLKLSWDWFQLIIKRRKVIKIDRWIDDFWSVCLFVLCMVAVINTAEVLKLGKVCLG